MRRTYEDGRARGRSGGRGRRRVAAVAGLLLALSMFVGQAGLIAASAEEPVPPSDDPAAEATAAPAEEPAAEEPSTDTSTAPSPTPAPEETSAEEQAEEPAPPAEEAVAADAASTTDATAGIGNEGTTSRAKATRQTLAQTAGDPVHVDVTFEGCRGSAGVSFPATGPFICPDAQYTTGNLGKGWNELDRVPHRLTTRVGTQASATTDYQLAIVADHINGGKPGYDRITVPTVNAAKSHASCEVSASGELTATPGIGGTDTSLYRVLTIRQNKGTTCVFDWNQRLALGSHLYPGSSLHSNVTLADLSTGGIGARDIPLPVRQIEPQGLEKTMTASQGAGADWNITKSASPNRLGFGDTCDTEQADSKQVTLSIEWTKSQLPSGDILIRTEITASNPAHRPIDVSVTDSIYEGTGQSTVATELSGQNPRTFNGQVPAGDSLTFLHEITVASGTASTFNDVAVASYTDPAEPDVTIPGTTQATAEATVQTIGSGANETVTITDVEELSGNPDLEYRIDTPAPAGTYEFADATGGTYTPGTFTDRPVEWTRTGVTGSGSAAFTKTVRVTQPTSGDATLSDTARILGDEGATLDSVSRSVDISTDATVSLTIWKSIPDVLSGDESVTFDFEVRDGIDAVVATPSITFTAGETSDSASVTGLAPGTYTVSESAPAGWQALDDEVVTIELPECSGVVSFDNVLEGASAQVRKVTIPAGNEAGWTFVLTGPGLPTEGVQVTTDDAGSITFPVDLVLEGTYTVTEVQQAGFDQTDPAGSCQFTVDMPGDAGRTFSCVFENTQRGSITIVKDAQPDHPTDFSYTGDLGTFELDDDDDETLPSSETFTVAPGTYSVTEGSARGWALEDLSCENESGRSDWEADGATVSITLAAGDQITCTFVNAQVPIGIQIVKDGPTLAHDGDEVVYTFAVSLTEPEPLTDITLTDTKCDADPVLTSKQGGDQDEWLEPGETWHFQCSHVIDEAVDGDPVHNVATVTGEDSLGRTASDEDDHDVDLIHPAIRIVKDANPISGNPGDEVTYTYVVTNIGDTTLFDVSVDDDKLGHIGDIAQLEPGESVTLTATATLGNVEGDLINVGSTEGEDVLGEVVTDEDDALVTIVIAKEGKKPPKEPVEEIAFTGAEAHWAAILTAALLAAGIALLAIGGRRRRTAA